MKISLENSSKLLTFMVVASLFLIVPVDAFVSTTTQWEKSIIETETPFTIDYDLSTLQACNGTFGKNAMKSPTKAPILPNPGETVI